jgi:hypothetical protein
MNKENNNTINMEDILRLRIFIRDRSYKNWTFVDNKTGKDIEVESLADFNPAPHKIFSQDIIDIQRDGDNFNVTVIESYIRTCEYIAGVLVLEGNKTYGRTPNKKRLYYRCIPDDIRLPEFLVPYEIKPGFSKAYKNKYVVFRFDNWYEKHPCGMLIETIGDVDKLDAFYEYQLYCKNLHISIKDLTDKTREIISKRTKEEFIEQIFHNPRYSIEDRRNRYIFTIDPLNSIDYDDGFGIERVSEDSNEWIVSVYIANVVIWLETLDLWKSLSRRVSTIYLPDKRRPMLPTILSEALCSLVENQERFSLVMDLTIDESGNIKNIEFKNALIQVNKNYIYEDKYLINNDIGYKNLFDLTVKMDKYIKNSHDLVAYWMVKINSLAGDILASKNKGIFRRTSIFNEQIFEMTDNIKKLSADTKRVILNWRRERGEYVLFNELREGEKKMVHISSPIRRVIDIMNQLEIMNDMREDGSPRNNKDFYFSDILLSKGKSKIDYINTCMRNIKKVERNSEILRRCIEEEIMNKEYVGVLFERRVNKNGLLNYTVYIEELRLLSKITTEKEREEYSKGIVRMYMYKDEEKLKRKIRVEIKDDVSII